MDLLESQAIDPIVSGEEGLMRTITCLFFSVATLLLGEIGAGVGQPTDPVPRIAALLFVVAAGAFLFIDWPREKEPPRGS